MLQQLDELLERAEQLVPTSVSSPEFYRSILGELVELLRADGATVWSCRDEEVGPLFDTRGVVAPAELAPAAETIGLIGPNRTVQLPANVEGRIPNRTDSVRWIGCMSVAPSLRLALDVWWKSSNPNADNLADAITAVTSIVVEFHRSRQLARLTALASLRERLANFSRSVHGSLFRSRIAVELANEGASALSVDRISVLLVRGSRYELEAATSLLEINSRSNAVQAIESLVERLASQNCSLPWTANSDESTEDVPTQIAKEYLVQSGASLVRVEPLGLQSGVWVEAPAVAVFEMFGHEPPPQEWDGIADACRHAALAFHNAGTFESHSVWGRVRAWRNWSRSQRARGLLAMVVVLAAGLMVIPADFDLEAHGQVQPVRRRQVFAPEDGIVAEVRTDHGQAVSANDVLAVIRHPELDLDEQRVRGELSAANARLASIRAARVEGDRRSPTATSAAQLTADEEELKQSIASLTKQLEILNRRIADLTLRAPIDGQVVRWDLIRSLETRPVKQGQLLMQIMDTAGPWQLELRIPDRNVRHILHALENSQASSSPGLPVRFLFRMSPRANYSAKLVELNLATDLDVNGELSTLATVSVQQTDIPDLRPGSSVIAKIHCGRRSLGTVWFREFWEFVQTRLLF